jgi:hypothetical protein
MFRLVFLALAILFVPTSLRGQGSLRLDTLSVADRFLSARHTSGAVVIAHFRTAELRAAVLRLDGVVSIHENRAWLLSDILVNVDFNGNGFVATWRVVGPTPVIEAHLGQIAEIAKDRDQIYDHSIRKSVVKCACD